MPDGAGLPVWPPGLPGWPRALGADLAAAYVGLSNSTFRQVVAAAVPPVRLTPGRVAWLREDLDGWLDQLKRPVDAPAGVGDPPAPEKPNVAPNPIAAGLANLPPPRRAGRKDKAR